MISTPSDTGDIIQSRDGDQELNSPPAPAEGSTSGSKPRNWAISAVVLVLLINCRGEAPTNSAANPSESAANPSASAAAPSELQRSFQLYEAGQYEEAVASSKAVLAVDPSSADAYNNLAVSYLRLRRFDEAIQAAQEAIRLRPDFQLAKNNLAWIESEKAKAAATPLPPEQARQLGELLDQSAQDAQAGRYQECIAKATQAATLDPLSAKAFNNVGFCSANLQLWEEAIRNTEEAIRLDPSFARARNNLAWLKQEKQKSEVSKSQ